MCKPNCDAKAISDLKAQLARQRFTRQAEISPGGSSNSQRRLPRSIFLQALKSCLTVVLWLRKEQAVWRRSVLLRGIKRFVFNAPCTALLSPASGDRLGARHLPGEPSLLLGSLVSSCRSGGRERAGCSVWGNPSFTSFVPAGRWVGDSCKGPALPFAVQLEENPQQGRVKEEEKTPYHLQGGEGSCWSCLRYQLSKIRKNKRGWSRSTWKLLGRLLPP